MKIKLSKNQWKFIGTKTGWMKKAEQEDNVIAEAFKGEVYRSGNPKGPEKNNNFLIVTEFGDWSGFITLDEALKRLKMVAERSPEKYYAVVER